MRRWGPAALFLLLAVLHTWPLASAPPQQSLNHNADAQLNAWAMAWIAHTLPSDPARVFDANIFAPEKRTLTYSEPIFVPALVGAPLWWLGGSAVLAYNVSLIVGLALTGWAAWFVAWRWTGSASAALVAGALAAFNPHLLTRLPHIQAAYAWTIPLALYLADRLIDEPRQRRTAIALAGVVTATAATSAYWLALVGLTIGVVAAVAAGLGRWRGVLAIVGASVGGLVVASPILLPYVQFASTGATRPIEIVEQFSATLGGYLATPSRLHAFWSTTFYTKDVSVFFAGFTAIGLAAIGLRHAGAVVSASGRRTAIIACVAVLGVVLSFGPATAVYRWAYEWVFPLRGLRAAARFGFLYLVAVALVAAWGVAWLERRAAGARARVAVAMTALALVTAEAWTAPILTVPFTGVPPIYELLASEPDSVLLAEMPFYPADAVFENGEYQLNSTAHWRPLMNGTSGFTPMSYREIAPLLWYFPEPRAMDAIARRGITHVMVHLERFTPREAEGIAVALRGQSLLRLIAADATGHRLYRVVR